MHVIFNAHIYLSEREKYVAITRERDAAKCASIHAPNEELCAIVGLLLRDFGQNLSSSSRTAAISVQRRWSPQGGRDVLLCCLRVLLRFIYYLFVFLHILANLISTVCVHSADGFVSNESCFVEFRFFVNLWSVTKDVILSWAGLES